MSWGNWRKKIDKVHQCKCKTLLLNQSATSSWFIKWVCWRLSQFNWELSWMPVHEKTPLFLRRLPCSRENCSICLRSSYITYTCLCVYKHRHTQIYTHIFIYTDTYVNIYTNIHIQMQAQTWTPINSMHCGWKYSM